MANSRLMITDGTLRINLLAIPGFQLESWRPVIPAYKGDGTYQSSPLSDGRQIVNRQFDNPIEQLSYKSQDFTQDELITRTQDLVRLLEKAVSYWVTDWQNEPVWIEASAKCETNIRYGHIMSYRIPELENPFNQPFLQPDNSAVMDSMTLILEHTIWTENQPGTGTAVELSAVETYDGRSLGNVDSVGSREPTTANEVYVANKRNEANLTDIYRDDGGAFSPNLMDVALPYKLLPTVPAVNDAIYFGIDTSLSDSGPFSSLVFDIGTAGSGYTADWEYWNGAIWAAFGGTVIWDNTDPVSATAGTLPFGVTGVNSVHLIQPSNWATTTVNGVTGYWVRVRVLTVPGPLVSPTQQNRDVYSIIWPYVEIQSNVCPGDIISLLRMKLYNQSGSSNLYAGRFIFGLRTYDRGANFTAYINLVDEQNPSGITITALGGISSVVTDASNPTGKHMNVNVNTGSFTRAISIALNNTIVNDFYGKYHIYLRGIQTGGSAGSIQVRMIARTSSSSTSPLWFTSNENSFTDTSREQLLDLGNLTTGPSRNISTSDVWNALYFEIEVNGGGAGESIQLLEWILIPADEFTGDCSGLPPTNFVRAQLLNDEFADIDGVQFPKSRTVGLFREVSTDLIINTVSIIQSNIPMLQANSRQRMWFLNERSGGAAPSVPQSDHETCMSVQFERNSQYTTMRGNR